MLNFNLKNTLYKSLSIDSIFHNVSLWTLKRKGHKCEIFKYFMDNVTDNICSFIYKYQKSLNNLTLNILRVENCQYYKMYCV